MNIWIVNHYAIPPSMGGLVRHYYFSKYLQKKGHTVRIFTSSQIHNTDINMITDKALYKEKKIDGRENTIIDNEEYSQFLQKFITEKDTFSSVERIDTSLQLKKALESLSAIEQAVIFLLFQKELTQREAAEILEVYTKTISKIKIRAINKLKKYLEEDL